jgi:hypothetical protein
MDLFGHHNPGFSFTPEYADDGAIIYDYLASLGSSSVTYQKFQDDVTASSLLKANADSRIRMLFPFLVKCGAIAQSDYQTKPFSFETLLSEYGQILFHFWKLRQAVSLTGNADAMKEVEKISKSIYFPMFITLSKMPDEFYLPIAKALKQHSSLDKIEYFVYVHYLTGGAPIGGLSFEDWLFRKRSDDSFDPSYYQIVKNKNCYSYTMALLSDFGVAEKSGQGRYAFCEVHSMELDEILEEKSWTNKN